MPNSQSSLAPAKRLKQADAWYRTGLADHAKFRANYAAMKMRALSAGYWFIQARNALDDAGWAAMTQRYSQHLGRRQVQTYMTFASDALEQARRLNPGVAKQPIKLLKAATDAIMESPKPFTALLRDLHLMRQFGEYDAVKYQQRKTGSAEQLEFRLDFSALLPTLDTLDHLDDPTLEIVLPEGQDERQALQALSDRLHSAQQKISARLETLEETTIIER